MMPSNNQIELFQTADGSVQLEIKLEHDSLWLTQAQISELFATSSDNVSLHLKNIYADKELAENATSEDFSVVRQEGARKVKRSLKHYNLDAIISAGYRVSSARATQFRIWATNTLKQHLVQGYTLNQKRLAERGIEFEQAVKLLSQTLTNQQLVNEQGAAVVQVIHEYARSWSLLQQYDEQSLTANNAQQQGMKALVLEDTVAAINELKQTLISKGEATELFGQLRGNGLESAISTIEQGFGDEWFYPNIASRAANLLYLVIKNHPLADGNKRSGSFLFLWYLRINQHFLAKSVEQLINDNTLVALALLIAESKPDQKDLMIHLVQQFILLKGDHA
jgi:prophage maintenance system killer protein